MNSRSNACSNDGGDLKELFLEWLRQWQNEEKIKGGGHLYTAYKKVRISKVTMTWNV